MTTPATPPVPPAPLSGPIPPSTAPPEPDIVDQVRALRPEQQTQLFTAMSPAQKTAFSTALDRKLQAQKFQNVPSAQDPILQQNPGQTTPSAGPLPGIVRKTASFLPAVGGTLGGVAGTAAGGAAGTAAMPGAGTTAGGIVGGAAGAAAGGAAGKAAENEVLDQAFGEQHSLEEGTGWEATKQAAYELGGRAVGAVLGRAVAPLARMIPEDTPVIGGIAKTLGQEAPTAGENISGVQFPETLGQQVGKPGGMLGTVEHYLGRSYLGGPLREVKAAQEAASRQVLANLSKAPGADTSVLAENWEKAREVTRATASPIYDGLAPVEVPKAGQVAKNILSDEQTAALLPTKAKNALAALSGTNASGFTPEMESMAKNLGYTSATQAYEKMGPNIFKSLDPSFDPATAAVTSSATFGDALLARHAIGEALNSTGRAAERRTLSQAYQDLNGAMDSALDPQQLALKQQADLLWRRSYIMDKIGQSLTKMESTQPIGTAQQIVPQSFIKTVNQLAKQDIGRNSAGNLVKKPSQLDILYDNPADKQSMVQLANFLSTKYSRLTGAGGIGEKMAQIGLIAETIHLPIQLATGNYAGAAKTAGVLSGTYILSKALARPGGPALLLHYFNSAGADAAAAATRIAMQGASNYIDNKDEPEEKPAPPPPAPPPPSVPEHIAIAERAKQQQGIQ